MKEIKTSSKPESVIDQNLYDFKKKRICRDFFLKERRKLCEKFQKGSDSDKYLKQVLIEGLDSNITSVKASLTTAYFLIPSFDIKKIKLFRWHGHVTEERFLDDRSGFLMTYEDKVIWQKVTMIS
jgi:hypothetical protein